MKSLGVESRRVAVGSRCSAAPSSRRSRAAMRSASSGDWRVLPSWSSGIAAHAGAGQRAVASMPLGGALGDRRRAGPRRRPRETKSQTSGCMRRVWSRKTPRSGGIVPRVAEQVLEHRGAGAGRVGALARPGRAGAGRRAGSRCGRRWPSRARRRARPGRPRRSRGSRRTRASPRGTTARRCPPSARRRGRSGSRAGAAELLDQRLRRAATRSASRRARVLLQPAEVEPRSGRRAARPRGAGC